MIRSHGVEIIARRLGLNAGRVAALAQRAADAGLLPKANGGDIPDLGSLELARLFLASVCDNGIGNAARSVQDFSALQTERGIVLLDVLEALIAGRVPATSIRSAIFQLRPAGATLNSETHLRFGATTSTDGASRNVIIPGDQFAAICCEFQGMSPEDADNAIAVGRLAAALH